MINSKNNKYIRTKHENKNGKVHYIEPKRLQLFTKPFNFSKCLKLKAEADGGFQTASFLISWVPEVGYTVHNAAVASIGGGKKYAERNYWVSSKQLYDLQNSAKNVVLMLWEVFRRPTSESMSVKVTHVPTHRLLKDWSDQKPQELPRFKMQKSCKEVALSFLG